MRQEPPYRVLGKRETLVRLIAAWLGVLCLAAQFSSALHFLLVDHVRCAEHGDWVHVDAERGDHVAHPADVTRAEAPLQTVTATADEQSHEHDHCVVDADRRKLVVLPASHAELRAPEGLGAVAVLGRTPSPRSTHVYCFAPKTSPPV